MIRTTMDAVGPPSATLFLQVTVDELRTVVRVEKRRMTEHFEDVAHELHH
jgi:hypothetical protein